MMILFTYVRPILQYIIMCIILYLRLISFLSIKLQNKIFKSGRTAGYFFIVQTNNFID